ncbi:MAG: prokaryotic membrane lipolipid attachment site family protein [Neisseriaceae bacterium]|nr:prokaryotic membrane lipolipid attachment site family protein [Neisseriaceae bacterium]
MKTTSILTAVTLTALLSGCGLYSFQNSHYGKLPTNTTTTANQPQELRPVTTQSYQLADSHWSDVQKIRNEATRLSGEVGSGTITKVQAAQYLNRFRLNLVGNNPVDDHIYEVYLRSAVSSQSGQISTAQSKQLIQTALEAWQQSWPTMSNKPANPAFTNFLLQTMGMSPLQ